MTVDVQLKSGSILDPGVGKMTRTSWLDPDVTFISTEKKSTSRYASRCCCDLALPQSTNPSDILLHHLRSSALTTRPHEKHSRAGCQKTRVRCWLRLRVDPVVDLVRGSLPSAACCAKMGCRRGSMQIQSVRDFWRIMQASIMNDLVPGLRFPEGFCGYPTTLCSCFHTPLRLFLHCF